MINNEHINVTCCLFSSKALKAKSHYAKLKWYQNGKARQKVISTGVPLKGNNKRKAQAAAEQIRLEFERKLNEKPKEETDILFSDFMLDDWLVVKKTSVRRSTYEGYKKAVENGIKPYFDKHKITLQSLTASDIQGFYTSLLKKGLTANTVKHYHSYLSNSLRYALKLGLINYNPIIAVERPKVEHREMKAFTEEELQNVLTAVKGDTIETAVYLAAYGGMRRSEILGLLWSDIDFDNDMLLIHRTRTDVVSEIFENKTKSETSRRYIPLAPELKAILLEEMSNQKKCAKLLKSGYSKSPNFVCRYEDGRALKSAYLSRRFKRFLIELGYDSYNFHSLRHTLASIMANSGTVGIKTVSTFLGHSNLSTTSLYVHADDKAKREAIKIFSDRIKHGISVAEQ